MKNDFITYVLKDDDNTNHTMNPSTTAPVRIVTIPLCPDLLRYDQLGEADNLRGRVVRAFFWLMRVWSV
jgi:hypothetical protein